MLTDNEDPRSIGNSTGPGWEQLVNNLHDALIAIDPNYTWVQIKQKFCCLSFYIGKHDRSTCPCTDYKDCRFESVIADAIGLSRTICENCGEQCEPQSFGMLLCGPCEAYRSLRYNKTIALI